MTYPSSRRSPFSLERLLKIRRMRKARRFWRQEPLFAFAMMQNAYPGYTEVEFQDDLRRRRPSRKRPVKNVLSKYGRYRKIQSLLKSFRATGDFEYVLMANVLRLRVSKPYIIRIRKGAYIKEYRAQAEIDYARIEQFTREANLCESWEECDALFERLMAFLIN